MNHLSRSTALKIAAVISFLLAASDLFRNVQMVLQGPAGVSPTNPSPPYPILVLGIVGTTVGVVSAYGTWKAQRWGIVLTIIVNLLGMLITLPAYRYMPSPVYLLSPRFQIHRTTGTKKLIQAT